MEQVTPLFKKNDEFKKEYHRPVTVLPALNNIYEKLLVAQLGGFCQAISFIALTESFTVARRHC